MLLQGRGVQTLMSVDLTSKILQEHVLVLYKAAQHAALGRG